MSDISVYIYELVLTDHQFNNRKMSKLSLENVLKLTEWNTIKVCVMSSIRT